MMKGWISLRLTCDREVWLRPDRVVAVAIDGLTEPPTVQIWYDGVDEVMSVKDTPAELMRLLHGLKPKEAVKAKRSEDET